MLRVIGTGLPRTGTNSLKLALETLLGEPCYHMFEAMPRMQEHAERWMAIAGGEEVVPDWSFLDEFGAIVDWPGSAVWQHLVRDHPDAVVVHSVRDDAAQWWASIDETVGAATRQQIHEGGHGLLTDMIRTLAASSAWGTVDDPQHMMRVYDAHDAAVRAFVPADRLVVLNPRDGWEPLCQALGLPIPDEPYPHANTRREFVEGLQAARRSAQG